MGFYGKVINYLSKSFSKIKINGKTLQATSYDEELQMNGDDWINLVAEEGQNAISYSHSDAQDIDTDITQLTLEKGNQDVTAGVTLIVNSPQYDKKGHYKTTTNSSVTLNIEQEISERKGGDEALSDRIGLKQDPENGNKPTGIYIEIDSLDGRIGEASEGSTPATGVYIPIEENANKIISIDEKIGVPSNDDNDIEASGAYIPIEQNAADIKRLDGRIGVPSDVDKNIEASGAYIPIEQNAAKIDDIKEEIGFASDPNKKAEGIYALIEANAAAVVAEKIRAEAAERELNDKIGEPAKKEGGQDIPSTGLYAYVDATKDAILGENIKETFDTLVEIQEWIEGDDIDTIELTQAIADEAKIRSNEDELIYITIRDLGQSAFAQISGVQDAIYTLNDDETIPGSVLHTIGQELFPISEQLKNYEQNINNNVKAIELLNESKEKEGSILYTIDAETTETRQAVETNRQAIELLNKDEDEEGSVAYTVAQAFVPYTEEGGFIDQIKALQKSDEEQNQTLESYNQQFENIADTYETIENSENKLNAAKEYADQEILKLEVQGSAAPYKYVSSISQKAGVISPVYQSLPFEHPKSIDLEYDEAQGQLYFPSYFKIYAIGDAPQLIYVYDGGEI